MRTPEHNRKIGVAVADFYAKRNATVGKYCPCCGETKALPEWGLRKNKRTLRGHCRQCERAKLSAYSKRQTPEQLARTAFVQSLYMSHGIREKDFIELLENQDCKCAICGVSAEEILARPVRRSRLCIDHCHRTTQIRGLLCDHCNRGIGFLGESPIILRKAAEYIETAKTGKFSAPRRGRRNGKPLGFTEPKPPRAKSQTAQRIDQLLREHRERVGP